MYQKAITQLELELKFHEVMENGDHQEEKMLVFVQTDQLDTIVQVESRLPAELENGEQREVLQQQIAQLDIIVQMLLLLI